jgi:hypothetical protein
MQGDKADERDLERQLWTATETIREALLQLLQASDIHPNVIVLALARVAGETGTAAALVSGEGVEQRLDDLAEVVRRAGLEQHLAFQSEGLRARDCRWPATPDPGPTRAGTLGAAGRSRHHGRHAVSPLLLRRP